MLTCGYIGAGEMGGQMIERLLAAGTKVVLCCDKAEEPVLGFVATTTVEL